MLYEPELQNKTLQAEREQEALTQDGTGAEISQDIIQHSRLLYRGAAWLLDLYFCKHPAKHTQYVSCRSPRPCSIPGQSVV